MIEQFYKKENNLFQSLNWAAFQENYGHETVRFKDAFGIKFDLPLRKDFIWIQKGPEKVNLAELKETAKKEGAVFVRLEPEKTVDGLTPVTKKGLLSGQASPKATRVLDLSKKEEELLAEMKPKTRYNIRLAEKKGVVVKMLDNEDILYELLLSTAGKDKGYAPHPKNYYTKMIKDLAKNDVAHIFVAEYEGEFLAAILVTFFGEVATYLHGGTSQKHKEVMAPYLCQWEAIKYAKKKGCKYYDFWGVSENDDPNDPWSGITKFKAGFGGEKVVFPGSFDLVVEPFWYNIFTFAAKARRIIK